MDWRDKFLAGEYDSVFGEQRGNPAFAALQLHNRENNTALDETNEELNKLLSRRLQSIFNSAAVTEEHKISNENLYIPKRKYSYILVKIRADSNFRGAATLDSQNDSWYRSSATPDLRIIQHFEGYLKLYGTGYVKLTYLIDDKLHVCRYKLFDREISGYYAGPYSLF